MKKKMFQKTLSLILLLALLISTVPVVSAKETAQALDGVTVPYYLLQATASSEETQADSNPASAAVDGSAATIWHTRWTSPAGTAPHDIVVDLGQVYNVSRLRYLPRQDNSQNGVIEGYKIYLGLTEDALTQAASGTWAKNREEKTADLGGVSARYIKLEAPSGTYASCAELSIEVVDPIQEPLWRGLDEAKLVHANAKTGTEPGQYPQDAIDALQAAIDEALLFAMNPQAPTEADILAETAKLQSGLDAFRDQVVHYTKDALSEMIGEAQKLYDETPAGDGEGQAEQDAKDAFLAVIEAARVTVGDEAADGDAVDEAVKNLTAGQQMFKDSINTRVKDLSGTWQLKLGDYSAEDTVLADTCVLPGTLDENEKGNVNNSVNTSRLSRKYTYTGNAVYQKEVFIPRGWDGRQVTFLMERTKNTRVWVNGAEQLDCSSNNTLGTAQEYYLTGLVPGEKNTITVQVRNTDYPVGTGSHMLTEETVTNWNGILGKIQLISDDGIGIRDVRVYPNIADSTATVKVTVNQNTAAAQDGQLTISAKSYNHDGEISVPAVQSFDISVSADMGEQEFIFTYDMGENVKLWSEFDPAMYRMDVQLTAGENRSGFETTFGMREFKANGRKFSINGKTTFLRGEGNSAVFPLTGYAYMTKEEWLDFFGKAQDMGINFFRFHSWTPPEEAFQAADELGIYMQPELYGFGSTPFNQYYTDEAGRILKYLANHPSFVAMTWGNELNTDNAAARQKANELREHCRAIDSTRLYAEGTNNNYWNVSFNTGDDFWNTCKTKSGNDAYHIRISFSWADASSGGILESTQPNSVFSYTSALAGYTKPIMNHEAGQYQVLPNFDKEIPKYESGIFEARNLQYYRDKMEEKGLLDMNEVFSRVSARISAIGYKADLETALRTPELAGYQLLSIQDFPGQGTAHVGMLDNFMDEKDGGFTKAEYKQFNDQVVLLGRLQKYIYTNDETFSADVTVSNYSADALGSVATKWNLKKDDGTSVASGILDGARVEQGAVTNVGTIRTALSMVTEPTKLVLELSADGVPGVNTYNIWVYPKDVSTEVPGGVTVARELDDETKAVLENGGKVLLIPTPDKKTMPQSVSVRWTTDYWSKMFHNYGSDQAYTMGMYVDETHPVFRDFPTEYFSDYQWYNLMKNSRAVILDDAPASLKPMAQNIDHMDRCYRLGSLFEAQVSSGQLLVCTFDLLGQMDGHPEVRQLYRSILNYMDSADFSPETELGMDYLSTLFAGTRLIPAYGRIEAESYDEGSKSFKTENGKVPGSDAAETAIGGISKNDWMTFKNVDFGKNGCKGIILNGANNNNYPEKIEVRKGGRDGELLGILEFGKTSGGWSLYESQEFALSRLTGKQDITLVFQVGAIAFNYLQFVEEDVQYRDPYERLEAENCDDIYGIDGGSYLIQQLAVVDITDQVVISFENCDFGTQPSGSVVLHGFTKNDYVDAQIRYTGEDGQRRSAPVRFVKDQGESYELQTAIYYIQEFPLKGITGVQDIEIYFEEGTRFDLECMYFVSYEDPKPALDALLGRAAEIEAFASVRPLFYEALSYQAFMDAYDAAKSVDRADDAAVKSATASLQSAIDGLAETGKSKSAYTQTKARYYDDIVGKVNLERQEPDRVVGNFDPGEALIYRGLDFGDTGSARLTICGANASTYADDCVLRVWYGDFSQYVDVAFPQTGGWGAADDREVTFDIPQIKGVSDIKIELLEGGIAFNYFVFEESPALEGDVSGDGRLGVDDLIMIKQHILSGGQSLNEEQRRLADVNHDGRINIFDLLAIKLAILNG